MSCVHWNDPLLTRLSQDLAGWRISQPVPGMMAIALDAQRQVTVIRRRERLFLGRIDHAVFRMEGSCTLQGPLTLRARQPGWLKRRPVAFYTRESGAAAEQLLHVLKRYPVIAQTLGELDYRRFRVDLACGRWCCEIELFAACEARLRIPPMQRYLRLSASQRVLLLSLFQLLAQMMAIQET